MTAAQYLRRKTTRRHHTSRHLVPIDHAWAALRVKPRSPCHVTDYHGDLGENSVSLALSAKWGYPLTCESLAVAKLLKVWARVEKPRWRRSTGHRCSPLAKTQKKSWEMIANPGVDVNTITLNRRKILRKTRKKQSTENQKSITVHTEIKAKWVPGFYI